MYRAGEIESLHIELSTRCNASCPQCSRNIHGGVVNPRIPLTHLTLENVRTLLPPPFMRQMKCVDLCGNYGDPAMAPEAAEIVEYIRQNCADAEICFMTNGGIREVGFWEKLAGSKAYCVFGIDGLEDTNPLYRRGVQWDKLMRNVKAFISAGGKAIWHFLVFSHNEHQVEEARALAKSLGFERFEIKFTRRFVQASTGELHKSFDVRDQAGNVEYSLAPPKRAEFQNQAANSLSSRVRKIGYETYLASTPIRCDAIEEKRIYISAEGLVFPCCYLGHIYQAVPNASTRQLVNLMDQVSGGKESLNGLKRSIPEILNDRYFQEVVPAGWAQDDGSGNRTRSCARLCGDIDLYYAQYEGRKGNNQAEFVSQNESTTMRTR